MEINEKIILETGRKIEPRFMLDKSSISTYKTIMAYLNNDPEFKLIRPGYSLNKGLLVRGRIGSGKTLLLKIIYEILRDRKRDESDERPFYSITANHIVQLYSFHGYEILNRYHPSDDIESYGLSNNNLFIDDIGSEPIAHHFGRKTNIIEELLLLRYDDNYITHATTNLDAKSLKEYYGERVFSRMKEMFNDITMEGGDRRG